MENLDRFISIRSIMLEMNIMPSLVTPRLTLTADSAFSHLYLHRYSSSKVIVCSFTECQHITSLLLV